MKSFEPFLQRMRFDGLQLVLRELSHIFNKALLRSRQQPRVELMKGVPVIKGRLCGLLGGIKYLHVVPLLQDSGI